MWYFIVYRHKSSEFTYFGISQPIPSQKLAILACKMNTQFDLEEGEGFYILESSKTPNRAIIAIDRMTAKLEQIFVAPDEISDECCFEPAMGPPMLSLGENAKGLNVDDPKNKLDYYLCQTGSWQTRVFEPFNFSLLDVNVREKAVRLFIDVYIGHTAATNSRNLEEDFLKRLNKLSLIEGSDISSEAIETFDMIGRCYLYNHGFISDTRFLEIIDYSLMLKPDFALVDAIIKSGIFSRETVIYKCGTSSGTLCNITNAFEKKSVKSEEAEQLRNMYRIIVLCKPDVCLLNTLIESKRPKESVFFTLLNIYMGVNKGIHFDIILRALCANREGMPSIQNNMPIVTSDPLIIQDIYREHHTLIRNIEENRAPLSYQLVSVDHKLYLKYADAKEYYLIGTLKHHHLDVLDGSSPSILSGVNIKDARKMFERAHKTPIPQLYGIISR